jgi:hypothetical protein
MWNKRKRRGVLICRMASALDLIDRFGLYAVNGEPRVPARYHELLERGVAPIKPHCILTHCVPVWPVDAVVAPAVPVAAAMATKSGESKKRSADALEGDDAADQGEPVDIGTAVTALTDIDAAMDPTLSDGSACGNDGCASAAPASATAGGAAVEEVRAQKRQESRRQDKKGGWAGKQELKMCFGFLSDKGCQFLKYGDVKL